MSYQHTRVDVARASARAIRALTHTHIGLTCIKAAKGLPAIESCLNFLIGFYNVYPSLEKAKADAARYIPYGHEHTDAVKIHLDLSHSARPSDYPVLYHLERIASEIHHVFDLGGNVGNLFYCYQQYLNFTADLRWTVFDLPEIVDEGRRMAQTKHETRLEFVRELAIEPSVDLLIASGSAHYFEQSIPELLMAGYIFPEHVIINRTPLTKGHSAVTIQDAGTYLVPCKIFNRDELLKSFDEAGYSVMDDWTVPELSVSIPCHPELSVPSYSGLYLRRRTLKNGGQT